MCCLQMCNTGSTSLRTKEEYEVQAILSDQQQVIPDSIQQLLTQYEHLFRTSSGLPPQRAADHKIQLVPEAQPV
jgi:hypothetical protein